MEDRDPEPAEDLTPLEQQELLALNGLPMPRGTFSHGTELSCKECGSTTLMFRYLNTTLYCADCDSEVRKVNNLRNMLKSVEVHRKLANISRLII